MTRNDGRRTRDEGRKTVIVGIKEKMEEHGIITKIENGVATVETAPKGDCKTCGACGGGKPREIKVDRKFVAAARVGDTVCINVPTTVMMRIYTFLYLAPLLVFLFCIVFFHALSKSPLISFFGALLITISSCFLLSVYLKKETGQYPNVCLKE